VNGTSITVKVPSGTRDGHKLRLGGKGVPAPGGHAGDLILTVKVLDPVTLAEYCTLNLETNFAY
jgi:molecular chaperone DnaJ